MLSEADEPRPKCVCCVLQTWSFNTNYPRAFTFCEQNCLSPLFTLYHVSQRREGREGDSFTKQGGPVSSKEPLSFQRILCCFKEQNLSACSAKDITFNKCDLLYNNALTLKKKERRQTQHQKTEQKKHNNKKHNDWLFFVKKFVLNWQFNHIHVISLYWYYCVGYWLRSTFTLTNTCRHDPLLLSTHKSNSRNTLNWFMILPLKCTIWMETHSLQWTRI